ncbi:sialidase family protein [Polaromonas sp.]|jgi:predicted neuraminidase|uniref:sialidase family protein n=1 Tax=Polaromonas sp. TaxID=1869339 RepID=UPI002D1B81AA|nr:sialidase family protein [Polaromonas sp.]HQS30473.1 exo-alpha-sialidase [Polaromonas sp.]HQS89752.1 exo-alpha-sialidase [Polaromonas sp.]
MTRHRLFRLDTWVALLLVLAFAVSGWKILTRKPVTSFVAVPQASPRSDWSGEDAAGALSKAWPALQTSPDGRFRFRAQFVSAAPGQAVHAASIVELRDGRLRAVWFSGSREGAADVAVRTAVTDAATLQWGPEQSLFERDRIQRGLWRYVKKIGNPVIARAPDGSLVLWMVNVSLGGWAGSSISWSRSTDDGATWSDPRRLVTSPFLNISTLVKGAPVAMADGGISLPVYHEFFTKFGEVLRLDSEGQVVGKTRIAGSQTSLQPVLLVAGPERAQIYMRSGTARALMASDTIDAGKSWSPTRPTAWSNPDSAVAGLVSNTGAQWLALNPASRNRDVLALLQTSLGGVFDGVQPWMVESSVSPQKSIAERDFDQLLSGELIARGASAGQAQAYVASAKRQLCNSGYCAQEYSYPYLLQSRDGYIHLVYTWHRTRIKHVWFDPLQPGPATGPR